MGTRLPRKRLFLHVEALESRVVLSSLTIALSASSDQFGALIPTVQAYGPTSIAYDGILDTGASPITFSAADQASFSSPIPIHAAGSAQAGGIGGYVQGDVSQPGTIYVDGIHALGTFYDALGFPQYAVTVSNFSGQTPGIQAFIGTSSSATLPTVTGTAIYNPSTINPQGLAALVAMRGMQMAGNSTGEPDVHFVSPSTALSTQTGTTAVFRIPLSLFGPDNYSSPGNQVTVSPLPVDPSLSVNANDVTVRNQEFLFDTGSQVTIISPAMATSLHLNLAHPTTTIQIQGVGGVVTVPGFTIHSLAIPAAGGTLTLTNVPVYVLNVGSGFDGVMGMNLFNRAASMLYNPYGQGGASLSVNFYTATNPGGVSPLLRRQNLPGQLPNPNGPFTSAQPTRPRSFMITVVFPSVPSFSTVQTSSYLFVALQTQPVTAASPAGTANSVVYSTGSPRNSISLTAGYGAVTISENAADVSRPSSQSDSPVRTPSSIPQLPAAPQDMTPDAPEAQVEAVTAFFAAEDSRGDAEVAAVVSDNAVTGEIAKLAVVVAGLWGSIYQKEPAQVRKPVVCTA